MTSYNLNQENYILMFVNSGCEIYPEKNNRIIRSSSYIKANTVSKQLEEYAPYNLVLKLKTLPKDIILLEFKSSFAFFLFEKITKYYPYLEDGLYPNMYIEKHKYKILLWIKVDSSVIKPKNLEVILKCGLIANMYHSEHVKDKYPILLKNDSEVFMYPSGTLFSLDSLSKAPTPFYPFSVYKKNYISITNFIPDNDCENVILKMIYAEQSIDKDTITFICFFFTLENKISREELERIINLAEEKKTEKSLLDKTKLNDNGSFESQIAKELYTLYGESIVFSPKTFLWYEKNEINIWCEIQNQSKIQNLIFDYIDTHSIWRKIKSVTTASFAKMVENNLKIRCEMNFSYSKDLLLSNGVLVKNPIGNVVLENPSEEEFYAFCSPVLYDQTCILHPITADFFVSLVNGNIMKLNIIRSWLRSLLLFDENQHVALVLEGVGASGKSTFVKLVINLISGNKNHKNYEYNSQSIAHLNLDRLANRFETHALNSCRLVIFGDISSESINKEASSILRKIISLEETKAEIKNGKIYSVTPSCKVLIHSNFRVESLDSGSGLDRRLIHIETPRRAKKIDADLIYKLNENLSGILNWILATPKEIRNLHGNVDEINKALNPNNYSVLETFIKEELAPEKNSILKLSAKHVLDGRTLYSAYATYADTYEEEALSINKFSDQLIDKLRSMGCVVEKIKRSDGRYIKGINWKKDTKNNFPIRSNTLITNLNMLDPFTGWIETDENLSFKTLANNLFQSDEIEQNF